MDTGATPPVPRLPITPDTWGSEDTLRVDTPDAPGTVKAGDCWGNEARGLQHRQKGRQPASRQKSGASAETVAR